MKREIKRLVAVASNAGWRVERTKGGHLRFLSPLPDGPIIVASSTPSDARALRNLRADLRRAGLEAA